MSTPAKKPRYTPQPRPRIGVYVSSTRDIVICVEQTNNGVWFLTWVGSKVEVDHMSDERFYRAFPKFMPDYPIRRALKKFQDSGFKCSAKAEKVIKYLLDRL